MTAVKLTMVAPQKFAVKNHRAFCAKPVPNTAESNCVNATHCHDFFLGAFTGGYSV